MESGSPLVKGTYARDKVVYVLGINFATNERIHMIRYVILLRFTERGIKQVSNSTGRAAAFREAAAKAGVRVEGQYWTTGPYDGVLILAAKEEMRLLQCVAALAAAGNVRTQTLRAFDAKEFEGIAK